MNNSYRSLSQFSAFTMLQLFVLILCFFQSLSFAQKDTFLQCLSTNKISNDITYQPKTLNYTTALDQYSRNARFNTSTYRDPTVIVAPTEDSQFQDVVNCAKKVGLQLRIRSGGHDYEGLSYTSKSPFAILDLFNYKSIDININDETAWVQAGATLGELYYKIWQTSKVHAFPSGVCPTIGIGGHISGGGYSNMLRKFGISVDNVIDAKIVDAKGRILDRKGMGEDLFWAIHGGGGASFGVILAYKIKLVRVPPLVTVFNVQRTLAENATNLVHKWQYIADKLENELFLRAYMQPYDAKNNGVFTVRASFIAMFLGDATTLVSILNKKFPELGVKKQDCKEMPWIKSVLFWAQIPDTTPETVLLNRKQASSSAFKLKSDYVKTPIPINGLQGAFNKIIKSGKLEMMFNPYGGRMSEIPSTETAFPHRAGNIFKIQYLYFWTQPGDVVANKNVATMRDFYGYMAPFVSKNPREAFLNYRDLDIGSTENGPNAYNEGKVYGEKYFKDNFERLVKVKTEVDPENFFRYEQSIPVVVKKY